jgi:hypothetical protein
VGPGPRTTAVVRRNVLAADDDDGVSAMTPATGIPPDSAPGDAAPGLRGPPHPRNATGVDVIDLLLLPRRCDDDDDVSTVTGAVPSPERVRRPTAPIAILPGGWDDDDDDDSGDGRLTVYEEDEAGSVVGGGIVVGEDDGRRRPQLRGRAASDAGSPPSYQCRSSAAAAPASDIQRRERLGRVLGGSGSWLTRTGCFRSAVDAAFDEVADAGGSGRGATLEGLRAGLLSVHLRMAVYVGAPACRVRAFRSFVFCLRPLLGRSRRYLSRRSSPAFAHRL